MPAEGSFGWVSDEEADGSFAATCDRLSVAIVSTRVAEAATRLASGGGVLVGGVKSPRVRGASELQTRRRARSLGRDSA
jgi:hypothetical protein